MKSLRSTALVFCIILLATLSCREELFDLVGDHDIDVIYSDDSSFTQPPATFVRSLSDGRVEIENGQTIYFRVSSVSGAEIELSSAEWINSTAAYMTLDTTGWPEIAPLTFSVAYSGAEEESVAIGITYVVVAYPQHIRMLPFVINGNP
jgi:hypothetical protein